MNQIKLVKFCFKDGISYGDIKDLVRRTASDKVLRRKAFNIAKNKKNMMDIINVVLLQWLTNTLIKSLQVVLLKIKFFRTSVL